MRETRRITHKLASVETLGAHSKRVEEEDASTWVQQMRTKDRQRKLAEQRVNIFMVTYTTSVTAIASFRLSYLRRWTKSLEWESWSERHWKNPSRSAATPSVEHV